MLLQTKSLKTALYYYFNDRFNLNGLILEDHNDHRNDLKIKNAFGRFLIVESRREGGITKLIELGGKDDKHVITTMPFS